MPKPLISIYSKFLPPLSLGGKKLRFTAWDVLAFLLVIGLICFLGEASRGLMEPLGKLRAEPLSLDPANLPFYATRTVLRMFVALGCSLIFTFTYATWAAKNRWASAILIPILDILQSVPILGFISVTVVFFMSLAPGRVLGAEFAAIFAIFTSQAWNMAFSFFQSLRTVPVELNEAARCFKLSPWMKFWRLEVPFAMPALIWNMMMSMSGGWFFVVAAEAISVGHTTVTLPGMGAYIALAIAQRDLHAIAWAIGVMAVVILLYDQLFFRPLVAWADRFRFEDLPGTEIPKSWVLTIIRRAHIVERAAVPFGHLAAWSFKMSQRRPARQPNDIERKALRWPIWILLSLLGIALIMALWHIYNFVASGLTVKEMLHVLGLGFVTMLRVFILIALASLLWVPVGVWVGLRPSVARVVQPFAQFMAAFPANLLFPLAVLGIDFYHANPDIWLSPLMILGTQWYILFNVVAGASSLPNQLRDVGTNFGVKGLLWWRKIALPGVFPFYVTGAITASGGSWNAAIVAELVSWGDKQIKAHGLGSYIAQATTDGDFHKIILGIAVMSLFVVIINHFFWRPLYWYGERKFRLD